MLYMNFYSIFFWRETYWASFFICIISSIIQTIHIYGLEKFRRDCKLYQVQRL